MRPMQAIAPKITTRRDWGVPAGAVGSCMIEKEDAICRGVDDVTGRASMTTLCHAVCHSKPEVATPALIPWLDQAFQCKNAAKVLSVADRLQREGKVATLGPHAGFVCLSTAELAVESGLTVHQLNRVLPKVKRLDFVQAGTWLRPSQSVGSCDGHRAVWLRIDYAKVPAQPGDKKQAPWRKPKSVKKPKKATRERIGRSAIADLSASLAALRLGWNDDVPLKSTDRAAIRKKAWAIWYRQADGDWHYAGKLLLDLACMMRPRTLIDVLSPADLWVLRWETYWCPTEFATPEGRTPDLDDATVIPVADRPFRRHPPSFAELLTDQRKALAEAGYRPSEGPKPPPAKTAKIPLEPIQEVGIHEQRDDLVKRRSMRRIMARRMKAATVRA